MSKLASEVSAFDRYDFSETLSRLDDITAWLKSKGFAANDRVRIYGRNIRRILEVQANDGIEALQTSIREAEAREIFWSYIDADEFVRAVAALRNSLGDESAAAPIERALNGPADLFLENSNNSAGRNFMFELIMGGQFAGAGFRPSFDKGPDVQVEFAGLKLGIQCKRPFSESGLQKNIAKAIHQLEGGKADLSLIAVSVSRLLNPGNPDSTPDVRRRELGQLYLQSQIHEIARLTKRFWAGKLENAGILFYAFIPIACQERPRYFFERSVQIFPLIIKEPAVTLLKSLAQGLRPDVGKPGGLFLRQS